MKCKICGEELSAQEEITNKFNEFETEQCMFCYSELERIRAKNRGRKSKRAVDLYLTKNG